MPSSKVFEQKKAVVSQLAEMFKNAETIVLADYRGLTVEQDTAMRKALREAGVDYHVFKNRLAKLAAEEAGLAGMSEYLTGPTAFAMSSTDAVAPARILKEFSDKNKLPVFKGGANAGIVLSADGVKALASIPDITILRTQLAYTLNSPITKLAMVIKAVSEKQAEGAPQAEEAPAAAAEQEPVAAASEAATEATAEAVSE